MKINPNILSIPPHISTSWKNITSLHMEAGGVLAVTLVSGSIIKIPQLGEATLKEIFMMHTRYLENESKIEQSNTSLSKNPFTNSNPFAIGGDNTLTFGFPFKLDGIDSIGNLGGFLQHNQEQAGAPNLPEDMIKKITSISQAMGLDLQLQSMPKAEPHCNCPYCQIARALREDAPVSERQDKKEEDVKDEELKFREWDIKDLGNNLYEVTNPLDASEHYQVFLGNPIGCTCGHKNCEHIRAVLSS